MRVHPNCAMRYVCHEQYCQTRFSSTPFAISPAPLGVVGVTLNVGTQVLSLTPTLFYSTGQNVTLLHVHGPATFGTDGPMIVSWDAASVTAFTSGNTVSFTMPSAAIAHLQSGLTYINVHTSQFPGGGIRGAIAFDGTALAVLTPQQTVTTTGSPFPQNGIGTGSAGVNSKGQTITEFGPSSSG